MGLIIAAGNTKPAFPYDYYYGVKINVNVADTKLERVGRPEPVSYTHLRAHETSLHLVCRLLLEKKK